MNPISPNTAPTSSQSSPLTEQEKVEGFKLLDALLGELAKEDAVREVVAELVDPPEKP